MDLISIIVPVYNVEKYLDRNLKSLVNQTYKEIEIIVVNDGSPDNSKNIILEFEKKYKRIVKGYDKPNGGLSSARNFGLKKAKGKYVAFVDSDDYVEKDYIEKLYQSIKKENSDIAICNIIDEYENTGKNEIYQNYIPEQSKSIYEDRKVMLNRFAAWNKLYKIDLFDNKKLLFDEGVIYEDLRLIPKLYLRAKKISFVEKPLYHYIIRDGSIMSSSSLQKNLEVISGLKELIKYFKREKQYSTFKDELEFMCIEHILIAAPTRIIKMSNNKEYKENIRPYKDFIYKEFPKYKNNIYIKSLSFGNKLAMRLIISGNYRILELLLKIRG